MRRAVFAAALLAVLLSCAAWAAPFRPTEPVMPLSQIKAGMKGYGKTVFSGSTVKQFPIEVLGVVSKKDRPSKLVLIRASGPDIDKAGGLATGMSGTPIYVDGKLIGAFAFGWDFGDPKMGLVTPAEQMVSLFNYRDQVPAFPKAQNQRKVQTLEERLLDRRFNDLYERRSGSPASAAPAARKNAPVVQPEQRHEFDLPQDVAAAAAAAEAAGNAPRMFISADGISRRAMTNLEKRLGMRVVEGGSGDNHALAGKNPPPKPGEAISALLAWGDVSLDVNGTLTAVDKDGRFVAFGHSFKNWGAVAYPVARSTVYGVVNSYESPFKLASAGHIVGMITQDRPEGVAGYFGKYPPAVSVRLEVEDRDSGKTSVKRFQMICDEHAVTSLLPDLLSGLADRELGRHTGGTVRWDVSLSGAGMPDGWTCGDVVTAAEDVMSDVMGPVADLVGKVVGNPYQPLGTFGLKVKVSATSAKRKLLIESLKLDRSDVLPGGEIAATVSLRPWRGKPVTRTFKLRVPGDASGPHTVTVRAGSSDGDEDSRSGPVSERGHSSFAQMLREIQSAERSCEVVVELTSQDDAAASRGESPSESRRRRMHEGSLRIFRSDYVVDGSLQAPLNVAVPKGIRR